MDKYISSLLRCICRTTGGEQSWTAWEEKKAAGAAAVLDLPRRRLGQGSRGGGAPWPQGGEGRRGRLGSSVVELLCSSVLQHHQISSLHHQLKLHHHRIEIHWRGLVLPLSSSLTCAGELNPVRCRHRCVRGGARPPSATSACSSSPSRPSTGFRRNEDGYFRSGAGDEPTGMGGW